MDTTQKQDLANAETIYEEMDYKILDIYCKIHSEASMQEIYQDIANIIDESSEFVGDEDKLNDYKNEYADSSVSIYYSELDFNMQFLSDYAQRAIDEQGVVEDYILLQQLAHYLFYYDFVNEVLNCNEAIKCL